MSEAAIVGALIQENIDKCDPPLADDEVRDIAHSVARYTPAETSESRFHNTDLGNARRLVALHGQDLRYCFPRKTWFVWDGIRWDPDNSGEVSRRAKATVSAIYAAAAVETNEDRRKGLAKWATNSESDGRINAMISLARSEPGIPVTPRELDSDPWLFNVVNGTIDLGTGQLREHRREDMITMLAPVVFDPEARNTIWENFLDRVLPIRHCKASSNGQLVTQ
jgi:putative DNA primase/helicase